MSARSLLLPERGDRAGWRRLVGALVGSVLVIALVVLAWEAARTAVLLDRAGGQAALLRQQVAGGDAASARLTMRELQSAAERAHGSTDGPLWAAAAQVPVVGDDVDALRIVARELDAVAAEAAPPVVDIATRVQLDAFTPQDGRVDIDNLEAAAPAVAQARTALDRADAAVQAIDTERVFDRLALPVSRLQATLSSAVGAARVADRAAQLLPDMLGGDGGRRYLLLIQNNAEVRSLGGIPGSFAILTARDGEVTMGRQGSAIDVRPRDEPIIEVPEDERAVLPPSVATDLRDTTIDPDFPSAARYAASLVADRFDTRFDGVVSVDPVTLAYLLEGLGPVTLGDGTQLTAANAVNELLNGVYRRYEDDLLAQDAVFEDAARRIFDAFVAGEGSTQLVAEGLVRAASDNRILVWAADEADQERIASTGVSGALPTSRTTPDVGVYLNNSAGSKMQYYLTTESSLRSSRCLDEGSAQELQLRTRLTSDAPDDAARLPLPIRGLNEGVRDGDQRLNVRVVAPVGATIERLVVEDEEAQATAGSLSGRRVATFPVTLRPGETVTIGATFRTAEGQVGDPVLATTPGIATMPNDSAVRSACR